MATMNHATDPRATTEISASPGAALDGSTVPLPTQPIQEPASAGSPAPVDNAPDPDIPHETQQEEMGVGVEGEVTVWEARYSLKNFLGRVTLWTFLTIFWIALGIYTWGYGHQTLSFLAIVGGIALGIAWIGLGWRILQAQYGHYYRLTNRRVFVSTGLFSRRRDQMELLRVQDVYTKQTLAQRWLSIGTVIITSDDAHLPMLYLAGVDDPKYVMDLCWHHARAERDRRSVKVDQI